MDTDYNRPRRPNADTITYLKSLPFNEIAAHEEIAAYIDHQTQGEQGETTPSTDNDDGAEYPQNLSAALAALDEIKNEVASLAGDEFGSQCLEIIARITVPYSSVAARKLLFGISGYMIHLSTHRFGSHVVQTILQNALRGKNNLSLDEKEICTRLDIDQDDEDVDTDLPSMKDILISISKEIIPESKQLAGHICGSHVLRSLLCILSGVEEELPEHLLNKGGYTAAGGSRRGKVKDKKKKKKKKKIAESEASSGIINSASFAHYKIVIDPRVDVHDSNIKDCFFSFIWELTGIDLKSDVGEQHGKVGDLQQLTCNPSAGPLLIIILRVLTLAFSTSAPAENGNIVQTDDEKSIIDFRLGITKPQNLFEKDSFAEILAKQILCWDDSIEDSREQKQAGEIVFGLSGETRGSHMLETLLRTSNDNFYDQLCQAGRFFDNDSFAEYTGHDVSNFVIQTLINTVRTRTQAESIIKCAEGIISNGYVLDAKNRRRGIFWRIVEMSAKFRIGQETLLKYMRRGFSTLKRKANTNSEVEGQDVQQSASLMELADCIPLLIGYQAPEHDRARIGLDAAGVRITYHLLRFVPRLCTDVLTGILTNLQAEELVNICNDGLGSRCIIDGILEGPTNQTPFTKAMKSLCKKLSGHWTTLAVERVGHHTVKKIFMKLKSLEDKKVIVAELSASMNRLSGNAMGRSIINDCAVREYMEGEEIWKNTVKKAMERALFVKEITEGDIVTNTKKRKRKRKKKDNEENDTKVIKENEDD